MNQTNFHKEINARIYLQIIHLCEGFSVGQEKDSNFFKIIFDVMIKLQAMSYHITNYTNLDKHYTQDTIKSFKENPNEIKNCHSLLYELEAFLFQMKSSLDITIKIMDVLFPGHFGTHTFGKNGNQLVKNLENFKRVKKDHIELIDNMISMIKNDKDAWLKKAVELRNTLCHYKTYTIYSYTVKKKGDELILTKPKILKDDPIHFMKIAFSNCIEFIQDLLSLSIVLSLPHAVCLTKPNIPEKWGEMKYDQYIKYSIGLNMNKITIKQPEKNPDGKSNHLFTE